MTKNHVAYLKKYLSQHNGDTDAVVDNLIRLNVVNETRCKALAVRSYVAEQVAQGVGKMNAMWTATELFSCSYEVVRAYIYYYTDINVDNVAPLHLRTLKR